MFKIFLTSPQTWLVLFSTALLEWAFIQWFCPPLTILLISLAVCTGLVIAWPPLFIRSDTFHRRYYELADKIKTADLETLLDDCIPSFREPALQCIALAKKIRQEFKTQEFYDEVDSMLQHLAQLAINHGELLKRSMAFGTDQQKQTMSNLLKEQTETVEGSLTALKRFSGNLTLFDLQFKDHKEIDSEIKAINLGLQEAIREIQHE